MPTLSLARPIENIESAEEVRVLAVIGHLQPVLSEWRKGEDLREGIAAVDQNIQQEQASLDQTRSELLAAQTTLSNAKLFALGKLPIGLISLGIISGGLLGAGSKVPAINSAVESYLGFSASLHVGLIVGAVAVGAGVVAGLFGARTIKKNQSEHLAELEKSLAQQDTSLTEHQTKRALLNDQLVKREIGFPEIKIADVQFGVKAAEIGGQNVLLDTFGAHPAVDLKAVDVSALHEGLTHISDKLAALLAVPPLLTPEAHESVDDPIHTLFGEEGRLQDLVSEFTISLGKLRDVSLHLPLIPRQSVLIERLNAGSLNVVENASAINLSAGAGSEQQIQASVGEVNRIRSTGQQVFRELSEVFASLESVCHTYANMRTTSVNTIHQSLIEVLNRATWCGRRIYCPRSIQAPKYIHDLLGIEPEKAHLLPFDELVERLRGDAEIAKRLSGKPEIETQLYEAYCAVQDFMDGVTFDEVGNRFEQGNRPKHIESQLQEALKQFGGVLQKAITGAAYPILNFSAEAQLHFDPESDEWASGVSPYVYSTADALKYGSVVKAYSDLMIPLWEHLWTEKADFRKSELFRTNESMIRMSEKESEKVIDIANQFRADMRTVRENVYLIESELKSKCSEIIYFRNSMDKLGLLSTRVKETITDDKLEGLFLEKSMLKGTDRYETLLSTMPQAQAQSRGGVNDPINFIRDPSALLLHRERAGVRLLPE